MDLSWQRMKVYEPVDRTYTFDRRRYPELDVLAIRGIRRPSALSKAHAAAKILPPRNARNHTSRPNACSNSAHVYRDYTWEQTFFSLEPQGRLESLK